MNPDHVDEPTASELLTVDSRRCRGCLRVGAATVAVAAMVLLSAPPAAAHAVGTPASPFERGAVIAGIVLLVLGLAAVGYGGRRSARGAGGSGWRRSGFPLVLVGAALVLGGPALVDAAADLRCGGRPSTDASIAIVSPEQGEVLTSTEVPVEVAVVGGEVASATATEHEPGTGHVHISVDGQVRAMVGEERQVVEVPPGEHTLEVEYSAGDHGSFCPPVVATRQIEVRP